MSVEGDPGAPGIRVLLVEDNPTDQKLVEGLLRHAEQASFDVSVAGTVADALEQLARNRFDVVLLDLNLPDSEGVGTFTAVRDAATGIPTVVVTGTDEADLGLRCVQSGAQDFLTKDAMARRRLAEALLYAVERWTRSREQALHDPLTGLATPTLLVHRLTEVLILSDREGDHVAVLTVDLGLPEGPDVDRKLTAEVVTVAGERIRAALRPFDILARTGPGTFAAIVPGLARPANGERAAQRVLGALISEIGTSTGAKLRLPARIGVAMNRRGESPKQLLDRAWGALRELKRSDAPALRMADPGRS